MVPDVGVHAFGDCVVVQIRGEIDLGSAPGLDDRLLTILVRPVRGIVTDLSGLEFADLAAIRVLLAAQRRARLLGAGFALARPRPTVLRVLELAGFGASFLVCPTIPAALGAVGRAAEDAAGEPAAAVTELIAADRARIEVRADVLRAATRTGPVERVAEAWAALARSVETHLAAMDEIFLPAGLALGALAGPRADAVRGDHADLREVLREARLQPAGAPRWTRLVEELLALWAKLARRQEGGILADFAALADQDRQQRVGREWRAFLAAARSPTADPPGAR